MKLNPGDIVQIEFLDHRIGDFDEIKTTNYPMVVWGRVVDIDDVSIKLDTWTYKNPTIERDKNIEMVEIIKATITEIQILAPVKIISISNNSTMIDISEDKT